MASLNKNDLFFLWRLQTSSILHLCDSCLFTSRACNLNYYAAIVPSCWKYSPMNLIFNAEASTKVLNTDQHRQTHFLQHTEKKLYYYIIILYHHSYRTEHLDSKCWTTLNWLSLLIGRKRSSTICPSVFIGEPPGTTPGPSLFSDCYTVHISFSLNQMLIFFSS